MARKRKRSAPGGVERGVQAPRSKRGKFDSDAGRAEAVKHPTLQLYYTETWSLRQYLLSVLPRDSKKRRRRIINAGCDTAISGPTQHSLLVDGTSQGLDNATFLPRQSSLGAVLDYTYVCLDPRSISLSKEDVSKDFEAFSQRGSGPDESTLLDSNVAMPELVDFTIWLLFNRIHHDTYRPPHILCHGFQRARSQVTMQNDRVVVSHANSNVQLLKGTDWQVVLNLLGKEGDKLMLDMLIGCDLFVSLSHGVGNLHQISGTPCDSTT